MNMEKMKKEWINGIHISLRIILLIIMLGIVYQLGYMTIILVVGALGMGSWIGILIWVFYALLILSLPIFVSLMSDALNLKAIRDN